MTNAMVLRSERRSWNRWPIRVRAPMARKKIHVDKTGFIDRPIPIGFDGVHILTRPTRFGRILNPDTIDRFLNMAYVGQEGLSEGSGMSESVDFKDCIHSHPVIRMNMGNIRVSNSDEAKGFVRMFDRRVRGCRSRRDLHVRRSGWEVLHSGISWR